MVYTLTLNPALDYFMDVPNVVYDDVNRSRGEALLVGGKGINVSYVLHQLGVASRILGFAAGFTGQKMAQMLTEEGLDHDFTYVRKGYTRINVKILSGTDLAFNGKGPEITEADLHRFTESLSAVGAGDYVVLAGAPVHKGDYDEILSHLPQAKTVIDIPGTELLDLLKYKPFLVKPNHTELGQLFGVDIQTQQDAVTYGKRLQAMGAANVLVSRGADGAVLIDEAGNVHASPAARGKVVSTVGCGDSMVAGFLAGYLQKGDYGYGLKLATACGGATAFSPGLATRQAIDMLLHTL